MSVKKKRASILFFYDFHGGVISPLDVFFCLLRFLQSSTEWPA